MRSLPRLALLVLQNATLLSCGGLVASLRAEEERFLAGVEMVRDASGAEVRVPWKLLLPAKVEKEALYPLVLFLHGAGERGDDNERQLTWLPRTMAGAALSEKYPCFVLAPQCPAERRWVEVDWSAKTSARPKVASPALEGALRALRAVIASQPIDPERIYLTGLSMGGFGTWDLAARHPTWFAAAAPICGGGDPQDAAALATLPIWCFHGAEDRTVPPDRSRAMCSAIQAAGGCTTYTELAGVAHDSWKPAYAESGELLPWLFAQRRRGGARAALANAAWKRKDRIAFLGDSITQSGGDPGGYVSLIEAALGEKRQELEIEIVRAGISGNKIGDLLARFERDVVDREPTLVFVYIGINDVWHQKLNGGGTPPEAFGAGLRELCTKLAASGARVVLATPSTIGEKRHGENELDLDLERYAEISRGVARELGLVVCDLRADCVDFLELQNGANQDRDVLTSDGVHLNAAGNAFVADRAAAALLRALALRKS